MKKLDNILIYENTTILETLNIINLNLKGTAIVVDKRNKLLGTITDGDIRRAILENISLSSSIKNIYNKNCIYFNRRYDLKKAMHHFTKGIKLIPVVDKNEKLVNYLELADVLSFELKDNYVVIMAGGLGTRLKELTKSNPKPMLRVGDHPMLQHIINNFKQYGYKKMLISVNYKADIIENYFQDGCSIGVKIDYIREKKRLGTCGGIKLAQKYLTAPFFVTNGDILTNLNVEEMMDFHIKNKYYITIGVRKHSFQIPYGVINLENNDIESIEEKPVMEYLINGGIYCLNPEVIDYIPDDKYCEITDLINRCIQEGKKVGSYEIQDYWMDIGKIEDYYKANEDVYDLIACEKSGDENDKL